MHPTQPVCAHHPRRRARTACAGCGQFLCAGCTQDRASLAWCGRCGEEPLPSPATVTGAGAPAVDPTAAAPSPARRRLRDTLPAIAAAVALLATTALFLESGNIALRLPTTGIARTPGGGAQRLPAASPGRDLGGPALALPTFSILPGDDSDSAFCLQGRAPGAAIVLGLVDGVVLLSAATVGDGRFAMGEVEIPPGDHVLQVVAIDELGGVAESDPQPFRYSGAWPPLESPPSSVRTEETPPPRREAPPTARPTPPARTIATPPVIARLVVSPTPAGARDREPAPRLPEGRGVNIVRGPSHRIIALTFDGGSDAGSANQVLDALRAKGVHSTLFLTGDFIRLYPDVTRRIVADGHDVGNHTFTHPHLADWLPPRGHVTRKDMSSEILLEELERTRVLFESTTGARMSRYWRAPYGEINREILGWVERAGWTHVGWTQGLDTLDWVADPSDRRYRSAPEIRDRLLAAARKDTNTRGGIVLMHLGRERTEDDVPSAELPRIIDGLRGEGYRIVTISALVGG